MTKPHAKADAAEGGSETGVGGPHDGIVLLPCRYATYAKHVVSQLLRVVDKYVPQGGRGVQSNPNGGQFNFARRLRARPMGRTCR